MHIIFNGPPGSGKDEACHFLTKYYNYKHMEFKKILFDETILYFGVSRSWFMEGYLDRNKKEFPENLLGGRSRRESMIYVSEELIKPKYGSDYFGRKTAEQLTQNMNYCFSDGGFVDEVLPVINKLGTDNICIVQLFREGCTFSSDSRNYLNGIYQTEFVLGHKTNHGFVQNHLPIRMYQVHNNATVSDFHQIIKTILRKEADVSKEICIHRESI